MTVPLVSDDAGVERLVAELLSPDRDRPCCVVSTPPGTLVSPIDVDAIAEGSGGLADVVVIATGHATWRLAELLPDRCAVWGGAGRVYPVGVGWTAEPLDSPLRFVYAAEDAPRAGARLLEDVLAMAATAGPGIRPPTASETAVAGVVRGIVAGGARAFVATDDERILTVSAELTVPGVPLDWYLTDGLRVGGRIRGAKAPLRLAVTELSGRDLLQHFGHGAVTPALVRSSARQEATLLLHPAVPVTVRRADVTSNPRDLVSQFLGAGEVVLVRVLRDPQGRLALRLDDLEDDEQPLPALPLVDGGPPWLVPGRDLVTAAEEEPQHEPAAVTPAEHLPVTTAEPPHPRPQPGPGRRPPAPAAPPPMATGRSGRSALQDVQLQLEAARAELRQLRAQPAASPAHPPDSALTLELGQERAKNAELRAQLSTAQREASDLRKRARGQGAARHSPLTDRDRFADAGAWIRHEVYLAWIERIGPEERPARPIDRGWTLGPDFAPSVEVLPDALLRKVFRTLVDVVVGLDVELDGRDLHRLREGAGGGDPVAVRPQDGASCWRVAVERNVPAARRVHFWRTERGVELSRVVTHDDFHP